MGSGPGCRVRDRVWFGVKDSRCRVKDSRFRVRARVWFGVRARVQGSGLGLGLGSGLGCEGQG